MAAMNIDSAEIEYDSDKEYTKQLISRSAVVLPNRIKRYSFLDYTNGWRQPGVLANRITPLVEITRTADWPWYQSLVRLPGTRKLRKVALMDPMVFQAWTTAFVAKLDTIQVPLPVKGEYMISKLRLKSSASNTYYDPDSLAFFTRINGEREMRNLMERYIFCTIAEVLRHIDNAEKEIKEFAFVNLSEQFTAHNAMWQVYALEAAGNKGKIVFPIVQMAPWSFSHKDFKKFVKPRPEVSDDRFNSVIEYRNDKTTNKLWALLYDVCSQPRSNIFAVTNYNYWSFGYFTSDRQEAHLSEPIEAPIDVLKDGGKTFVQGTYPPNALQILLWWIQVSRCRVPNLDLLDVNDN
ncbi:hypothetical protein BDZ89DRAFT_1059198 [Hymenopellis radicata]|nr:hypothetical protein BDZ89DRAFT_1059198 [Hymenopellis radicata]